jgi:hypothetical protein
MRNEGGCATWTEPGKKDKVRDTTTCGHCQFIIVIEPTPWGASSGPVTTVGVRTREVPFCRQCSRFICPRCDGKGCTPFMRKVEAREARSRMLEEMGIGEAERAERARIEKLFAERRADDEASAARSST